MIKLHLLNILTEHVGQTRGLMYKRQLPPNTGMLFVYDQPLYLGFWMKNTSIPLDLIFIGPDNRINEITSLEPFSLERVESRFPSVMALETNRGTADRLGITVGDIVSVDEVWSLLVVEKYEDVELSIG
ncbi:MAG TPA: DUF192 domain-containing protein [Gemmatimonadetes bacterium]|nr:DUF192 domain-containing protein [Gemmatimonadota bacterium]